MRIPKSDRECVHNFHNKMGLVLLQTQHPIMYIQNAVVSTKEYITSPCVHKRTQWVLLNCWYGVCVHISSQNCSSMYTKVHMAFFVRSSVHPTGFLCTEKYSMEWCVHKSTRLILLWKLWKHSISILDILTTLRHPLNVIF